MKLKNANLELIIDEKILEPTSLKLDGVEFLYQKTATWKKSFPILFPICGTLIDNEYLVAGQKYSLKRHGFFRDINPWTLLEQKPHEATFEFFSNQKFLDVYPWDFSLIYKVELLPKSLKITLKVTNKSDSTMYYSLGYHPGFLVQQDGQVFFDKPQKLYSDAFDLKYLVPHPQKGMEIIKAKISDFDFTNSQFFWTTNNQATTFTYEDQEKSFTLDLKPYLEKTFIIWSEENNSGYVCFEPMMGHADFFDKKSFELKDKDQMNLLKPNESREHPFNLSLAVKPKMEKNN